MRHLASLRSSVICGAVVVALVACRSDVPTAPGRPAIPVEPQPTLIGAEGTLIFPIVPPGEFQPVGVAIGLNNVSQVTGAAFGLVPNADQNKPYRWTPGQGPVPLIGCCDNQFGVDINDAGTVVGTELVDQLTGARAFVAPGITMTRLPILPGAPQSGEAHALAINNLGQIVGWSSNVNGNPSAVLWNPDGTIRSLGDFDRARSIALDINDSGQVIGKAQTNPFRDQYFWLWTPDFGPRDLSLLTGAAVIDAVEINNAGQIVGVYQTPAGQNHAFRWTPGTGLQDLGTLGGLYSAPTGLNDKGDVVGSSNTADGSTHAFLWTPSAGMEDITAVTGISDVRRLNVHLQTLTGTSPPANVTVPISNVIAHLVQLQVTSTNQPPTARFTFACVEKEHPHQCTFDASTSTDDVGIVSYHWTWGNGREETKKHPTTRNTWKEGGTYSVTLTVTDTQGAIGSTTQQVAVP